MSSPTAPSSLSTVPTALAGIERAEAGGGGRGGGARGGGGGGGGTRWGGLGGRAFRRYRVLPHRFRHQWDVGGAAQADLARADKCRRVPSDQFTRRGPSPGLARLGCCAGLGSPGPRGTSQYRF